MDKIRQRSVLQAVLLETLADYPDGLKIEDAYDVIDQNYQLPEEWYRQIPASTGHDDLKAQGHADWRSIPQEQLIELVPTEPQWHNEIRWARNDLRKLGYLDTTAPRGVWKLTPEGHKAVPTVTTAGWSDAERTILKSRSSKKSVKSKQPTRQAKPSPVHGEGTRAQYVAKLLLLTNSMPLDDLKMLVEIARVVRKRSITADSD